MTESLYYGYKHWTTEETPRCFYVGKGNIKRPYATLSRNHKWYAIVKRYGLRIEVCVGPITNEEAIIWEIMSIREMKTYSTNHSHENVDDISCNFTKGGDGVSGWKHTKDVCEKMSRSHVGKLLNKSTKIAISRGCKGLIKTIEHRQHLSKSNKGKNKGRFAGEKHHATTLSDDIVTKIRYDWLVLAIPRFELRAKYNVSIGILSGILTGRTFKHLLTPEEYCQLQLFKQARTK